MAEQQQNSFFLKFVVSRVEKNMTNLFQMFEKLYFKFNIILFLH